MYKLNKESRELVSHGVSTCAGCGLELIIRNVLSVLGENTIIVIPPGCAALFSGFGKETALKIPGFQGNLENTAAYAAGIKAGLEIQGDDNTTVLAFAGDGATADIGIQALSGMIERKDKVLYVCYDNEAYMNTGIQGSSATPYSASTTTTPGGKPTIRKNMMEIVEAHSIGYAATASVAYMKDLRKKVEKAKAYNGPTFLHIHTPCPTGWRYDPALSIEIAKDAVQSGAWLLYEYENGIRRSNYKVKELKPINEYIKSQGRFKHLSKKDIQDLQKIIERDYYEFLEGIE